WVIATAACRDAKNGKSFVAEAERICRTKVDVLSGKREAELSALGVVSGFHKPDGIVGDLGGGSLELTEVHGHRVKPGVTLPLGGLALQDISSRSIKKAEKIVRSALEDARVLEGGKGRTFYAIGGTWRALARLHMWQTGYPLHVMHGYVMPAKEAFDFSSLVHRGGDRRPPTVARLRRTRAGKCGADRASEGGCHLRARRARGPALFHARPRRARGRCADHRRQRAQPVAIALARAWRGAD